MNMMQIIMYMNILRSKMTTRKLAFIYITLVILIFSVSLGCSDTNGANNTADPAVSNETPVPNSTEPEPQITIDYPLGTANIEEVANGTAKNIPSGQKLWILVYPHKAQKFYPQGEANIKNEKWTLAIRLGNPENTTEQFDIVAVLANQAAQDELNDYKKNNSVNKGPWMWQLPNGAIEYNRTTVTRV